MVLLLVFFFLTPFRADRVEMIKENGESVVYLLGNVIIEQDDTRISCHKAKLNENRGTVQLQDTVLIKDNKGEIRADYATYYFDKRYSFLQGNVVMVSGTQTISAESLEYYGDRQFVRMYHNVRLDDTENRIVAYGGEGWYELDSENGRLFNQPRIEMQREEKTPIIIHAREFFVKNKENLCYGYDSVAGEIDSIKIFCDTITYHLNQDRGYMTNPLVQEKQNELKGLSGEFGLKKKVIDYFRVNSGIANYWTNEGAHNIIEGESINIMFQDGRAFKIFVEGNPRGRLYLKEKEADVSNQGINQDIR